MRTLPGRERLSRTPRYDVVVVGAGVAGLATAVNLSRLGYAVALVDRGTSVGDGSSTKNEGWLHRGTYHATSIADPIEAEAVARRCIRGHDAIRAYAPEAVETGDLSFAVVPEDLLEHARGRWDAYGVRAVPATRTQLEALAPDVRIAPDEQVFSVHDVGINTRMLMTRYVNDLPRDAIYLGTEPLAWTNGTLMLRHADGSLSRIRCEWLVIAAGYGSQRVLTALGLPCPTFRYWLSHLCITPRLAEHGVFSVAAGEAAMMPHGEKSITGLNEDAVVIEQPSFEPTRRGITALRGAMARRFVAAEAPTESGFARFTACTKIDLVRENGLARSLNVSVTKLAPRVTLALPGKMTEAPFVADLVARELFESLGAPTAVARRPMDVLR